MGASQTLILVLRLDSPKTFATEREARDRLGNSAEMKLRESIQSYTMLLLKTRIPAVLQWPGTEELSILNLIER